MGHDFKPESGISGGSWKLEFDSVQITSIVYLY